MPATSGSRKIRSTSAPAYYLGRPAGWWMTAAARPRAAPTPAGERARYRWPPCRSWSPADAWPQHADPNLRSGVGELTTRRHVFGEWLAEHLSAW